MHLKKMYAEFTSPSHPLLDAEKEERLYNILPLFTKVPLICSCYNFKFAFINRLTSTSEGHIGSH